MDRFFIYDLETTGVKYWKNGVHQLSFIIEVDGKREVVMDFKTQPNPKAIIEPKALEVGGVTEQQVLAYPPMGEVFSELKNILREYIDPFNPKDKLHLMGYNNRHFDDQFFRAFFTQNGDKYFGSWFWSDSIDVMVLASDYLRKSRHLMKNFKLSTVAEFLGIEVEEDRLHDATYDLELTKAIYDIVSHTDPDS